MSELSAVVDASEPNSAQALVYGARSGSVFH